MSVAGLITGGIGSFSTIPLLLLEGLGGFSANVGAGGIDWNEWARPPEGYRRMLDTSGIDLAERREAQLAKMRQEIGLITEARPEPVVITQVAAAPSTSPALSDPLPIPEPFLFNRTEYARIVGETIRQVIQDDRMEQRARQREEEAVLLLMAAVL